MGILGSQAQLLEKNQNHFSREEYLKEASKKYFWQDPSVPSFRLFEWQDDNGKEIEERELWRPVGYNMNNEHEVCFLFLGNFLFWLCVYIVYGRYVNFCYVLCSLLWLKKKITEEIAAMRTVQQEMILHLTR